MWTYETAVNWKAGKTGEIISEGKPSVEVATPPEFGGPEDIWTPEDLLAGSVATCIMTSALFYLDRAGVQPKSYTSRSTATMEKTATGLVITGIRVDISVSLEDAAQQGAATHAIEQAEKTCPVSNALQCPVEMTLQVDAG